jgi:hypothetical protein
MGDRTNASVPAGTLFFPLLAGMLPCYAASTMGTNPLAC